VHRIGRTARAGRAGVAISFCDEGEHEYLRDIQKLIKTRIPERSLRDDRAGEPARPPEREPAERPEREQQREREPASPQTQKQQKSPKPPEPRRAPGPYSNTAELQRRHRRRASRDADGTAPNAPAARGNTATAPTRRRPRRQPKRR
jgi:ATP-dependent RNA helicase RhlE